jgi:DNA-binding NtrC family response regulator
MPDTAATTAHPQNSEDLSLQPRVLIIDDESAIRESLEILLELEGFVVATAVDGEKGLQALEDSVFDLVLLDLALPGQSGFEILQAIRSRHANLPVVMITAYGTVQNVVEAMQHGANNFIQKPWENEKLLADIRAAIGQHRAETENIHLKRALKQRYSFENIVGKSDAMQTVLDLIAQVAPSRSTVLVQGESGTGKELIAKAIHSHSPRRDKPFIPVHTGAVPADLLESTLFGHVKGAFTSAIASKKGLFEIANGGTLFLDEIGTMALDTQAKLLRVLQDRKFMLVGGVQEVQVDVRIVAATNADIRQEVREGRFREDLYYRLNVITIDLPPLRNRKEDIPLLAAHCLKRFCEENQLTQRTLAPETMRMLMDYEWPGNVRELENVIERCVVLSTESVIGKDLLPESLIGRSYTAELLEKSPNASLFEILEEIEKQIITDRLEGCNWNQTEAAEAFRIPLSTLNQKIKRLNIEIRKKARE